jgi:16S rRNA (cytosine967-C5)-methyltransferase
MTTSASLIKQLSADITSTLKAVFWSETYATKAIQYTLQNHVEYWEDEKREVFSETVYDIIRWWRSLWYILDRVPSSDEQDLQKLLLVYLYSKKGDLAALEKKRGLDAYQVTQRIASMKNNRALRESIPDWLDVQATKELGARWDSVLPSLNKTPDTFIRVNTLKISLKELITYLRKEGLPAEPIPWCPDALRLMEKTNFFILQSYDQGFFEVQDAGSQMVSRLLDPRPGMRLVDACAGEGGKTLHCAALMKNKGKIIALDTQEWRLKELRKRAVRAGADTIETRLISSSKVYKRMDSTADRLLLDVPCSGLGTIRRNPDIKWKLTSESLQRLTILQQDILSHYSKILKPSGHMVYSVCSILPSEGEEQVKAFLSTHEDFTLLSEKRYWPDTDGTDGFYMALVERTQ